MTIYLAYSLSINCKNNEKRNALFTTYEKWALVTDIALAAISGSVALFIYLSLNGFNLGGIGSLGYNSIYIFITVSGTILFLDFVNFLVQMTAYIECLRCQNSASKNEYSELAKTLEDTEADNEKLHQFLKQKSLIVQKIQAECEQQANAWQMQLHEKEIQITKLQGEIAKHDSVTQKLSRQLDKYKKKQLTLKKQIAVANKEEEEKIRMLVEGLDTQAKHELHYAKKYIEDLELKLKKAQQELSEQAI